MTPHERLLDMLATRSARTGSFTLASGRHSTLYIDARLTTMSPDGLATIGPLALAALRGSGLVRVRARQRTRGNAGSRLHGEEGSEGARNRQADRGAVSLR